LREHFSLDNSFYNFKLTNYQNLDALIYGNKSRFINHGRLNANVCSMYIKIREETIIVFYALRDIEKGEELYFNYNGEESLDSYKCKYPFLM
jgi:SET domain-containing protein